MCRSPVNSTCVFLVPRLDLKAADSYESLSKSYIDSND